MFSSKGMTHLITMDLHQKEIQGFFDIPVDNLRASPFLIEYIQHKIPDYRNAIIVARNPGQAKRATAFAERLRLGIAVIHGELDKEVDGEGANESSDSIASIIKRILVLLWFNLYLALNLKL
jgi:phosphoribosylpyrophosphate synthetase